MSVAVIFGGAGFIGTHFARYIIANKGYTKIYLADINNINERRIYGELSELISAGNIEFVKIDVRENIDLGLDKVDLIANFAAIHREPGHDHHEYYETNLLGAENVCAWAEKINCNHLIFTSSIAPYGPSESEKTEIDLPEPTTAYGGSKLVAEKIHLAWLNKDLTHRHLLIVRPGVVFGPREGGNVSRMIKAIHKGYFLYMGNQKTRKAGIYIKELCSAIFWAKEQLSLGSGATLINMTYNPGPSVQEYVETIESVLGKKRFIPSMPYYFVYIASFFVEMISRLFNLEQPISPVRIKKLVISNNVIPMNLIKYGYEYKYSLREAMDDWHLECPDEWS